MSEDIDIEEHDPLDDPTIRRIFPDLAVIKKEISEYEQDLNTDYEALSKTNRNTSAIGQSNVQHNALIEASKEESSKSSSSTEILKDKRLEVHLRFKNFLDSLADDDFGNIDPDAETGNNLIKKENLSSASPEDVISSDSGNLNVIIKNLKKEIESNDSYNNINGSNPEKNKKAQPVPSRKNKSRDTNDVSPPSPKKKILSEVLPSSFKTSLNVNKTVYPACDILKNNSPSSCEKKSPTVAHSSNNGVAPPSAKTLSMNAKTTEAKVNNNVHATIPRKQNTLGYVQKNPANEGVKSLRNNIFILGSKPNSLNRQINSTKKRQLKLVLKDMGPYLKEGKLFCKHCLTLFPNSNKIKEHMNKVHSASTGSEAIVNNRKSYLKKSQCEICKLTLCSKASLLRHLKNIHKHYKPNKYINEPHKPKSSNVTKIKKLLTPEIKTQSNDTHKCFHCKKRFESQASLIEHLYDILSPKQNSSSATKDKQSLAKNVNSVNNDNKRNTNTVPCTVCELKFLTQSELDEHHREIHLRNNSPHKSSEAKEYVEEVSNDEACVESIPDDGDQFDGIDHQSDVSPHHSVESELQEIIEDTEDIRKKLRAYQCFICAQYKESFQSYFKHMNNHNIKDVSGLDEVEFHEKCKFCSKILDNDIPSYNRHITHVHYNKLAKVINLDDMAFHSAIFKCIKCDIFFLSANTARNHSEHDAIFNNWKCPDCKRLFKIKDKAVHLKQHLLSKNINVHTLNGAALTRLLYKCLKCAVHFGEKEYFSHYSTCDLEMPNSAYCKTCDILVNRNDMVLHELHHKDKKLQIFDFTLIETDIIYNGKDQDTKEKQCSRRSNFALTFCSICQCFISDVGKKRKSHADGKCKVLNPRVCRKCGLMFTPAGYLLHDMLHEKVKQLNIQAFYFYDIKSKKQIRPPVPKYPHCNICEVHFLNKKEVRRHECIKQSFIKCNVCKMKLTDTALKLHAQFHKYKLLSIGGRNESSFNSDNAITSTTNIRSNTPNKTSKQKTKKQNSSSRKLNSLNSSEIEEPVSSTTNYNDNTCSRVSTSQCLTSNTDNDDTGKSLFLYKCVPCKLTVDSYDKVVQHCHEHYDYKENLPSHKNYNAGYDESITPKFKFDPFYFRFSSRIWNKHVFDKLTQEEINNILKDSKYKFESRLKLDELQTGPSSLVTRPTIYKCDICQSCVSPIELYAHVGTTCTATKKYPCSVCGLCFISPGSKDSHEKSHIDGGTNASSQRIIVFNEPVHQLFTQMMLDASNKFILYQCRNCEIIIDKLQRDNHRCNSAVVNKCLHCGLLFYNQDIKSHSTKHKLIKKFQTTNMTVIIFGKFFKRSNKLKPSFNGQIYDFTLYKCTNCGLCLKSKNNIYDHVCVDKAYESQCPKCYLCFTTKDLEEHYQLHQNYLELAYDDFNSNIISFSKSTLEATQSTNQKSDNDGSANQEKCSEKTEQIYKCRCGLHFLEEINANKHKSNCNPRMKVAKQSCFRCDLLFPPLELFNHLLKHHSNKKILYKYDIIDIF